MLNIYWGFVFFLDSVLVVLCLSRYLSTSLRLFVGKQLFIVFINNPFISVRSVLMFTLSFFIFLDFSHLSLFFFFPGKQLCSPLHHQHFFLSWFVYLKGLAILSIFSKSQLLLFLIFYIFLFSISFISTLRFTIFFC